MRRGHGRGPRRGPVDEGRTQAQAKTLCIQAAVRQRNIKLQAGEPAVIHAASRWPRFGQVGSFLRYFFRNDQPFFRGAQTDLLYPLLDRKRSALAARRLRNGPRDVAVPRTSRAQPPPRSRLAPWTHNFSKEKLYILWMT